MLICTLYFTKYAETLYTACRLGTVRQTQQMAKMGEKKMIGKYEIQKLIDEAEEEFRELSLRDFKHEDNKCGGV